MSEHTPGPWRIEADDVLSEEMLHIVGVDQTHLATAYGECFNPGSPTAVSAPVKANARLIAAAPDLLAACEAVDRASSEFAVRFRGFPLDDDDLIGGVSGIVKIDVEAWKVVRRAIAKAKGGQDE